MAETRKGVLQTKAVNFEWTIERFYADCKNVGDFYTSPEFPVHYSDKTTLWYLHVYPKGKDEKSKDCVSLFLHFQSKNPCEVRAGYKCSIVSGKNVQVVMSQKGTYTFKGSSDNRGWRNFVEHAVIKDTEKGVLIDDTFTISCEITFPPMAKDVADKCYEYNEWQWLSKSHGKTISYEQLFGTFPDVTLNVRGDKIHSHKAILSCHSPVLKAMFENEMKEKKENSVDITDVEYEVMNELIRFVYSGEVENIEKVVKELMVAANKYDVVDLKALCERTLYNSLTVDNAFEFLNLADICNAPRLKKLTMKFVIDNLKDVIKDPNFKSMVSDLNPEVVAELEKAVAEKTEV